MNQSAIKGPFPILLFTVLFSFPIFGQQIIGPENVNSARAVTMLVEVAVIIWWLTSKSFKLVIPKLNGFQKSVLTIWFIFSILAVAYSDHTFVAAIRQLEWFTNILFVLALLSLFSQNEKIAGDLVFSIALAFFVIGLFLLFKWFTLTDPESHNWFKHPFVFGHVRHLGFFAVAGFAAAFYPLIRSPTLFNGSISVFLSAFCLSFIFWGGGRASMIAAAMAIILLLGLTYGTRRKTLLKVLPVVLIFSVIGALLFQTEEPKMGFSLNHGKQLTSTNQVSSGRLSIWGRVLDNVADHPLTGVGPDGYLFLPGKNIETLHPHSFVIQFIGDWGWIGGLAAILLLLSLFKDPVRQFLRRVRNCTPLQTTGTAVAASLTTLGLVDGTFYHAWSMMLVSTGIAAMLSLSVSTLEHQDQQKTGSNRRVLAMLTSVLVLVTFLQITVSMIAFSAVTPAPDSLKVRLVRYFPSNTLTAGRWIKDWLVVSPYTALDWIQWLQSNSKDAWYYYLWEADISEASGQTSRAKQLRNTAIRIAPENLKYNIRGNNS